MLPHSGRDISLPLHSQIAARLDSLRRASLDLPGDFGFPSEARHFDGSPHEQSSGPIAIAVASRQQGRVEAEALSAAAREFLSRRCSASLATADPSARHQERLSQALVSIYIYERVGVKLQAVACTGALLRDIASIVSASAVVKHGVRSGRSAIGRSVLSVVHQPTGSARYLCPISAMPRAHPAPRVMPGMIHVAPRSKFVCACRAASN